MRGPGRADEPNGYEWSHAEQALAAGIHPEVVAARLGEPIDYLLKVADEQGWPIRWQPHETPMQAIERCSRLYGFDA
jgi:hypothetical protein